MENLIELLKKDEWRLVPDTKDCYLNNKGVLLKIRNNCIRFVYKKRGLYKVYVNKKVVTLCEVDLLKKTYAPEEWHKDIKDKVVINLPYEVWLPVVDYEDCYEVSNLGRIKRVKTSGNVIKAKLITGKLNKYGYTHVHLCYKGKPQGHRIHRLVALAFIPNPENKPEINHINGIKTDNHVENLEWVTPLENTQHSWKIGLSTGKRGEDNGCALFTNEQVIQMRNNSKGKGYLSQEARELGIKRETYGKVIRGKAYKYLK